MISVGQSTEGQGECLRGSEGSAGWDIEVDFDVADGFDGCLFGADSDFNEGLVKREAGSVETDQVTSVVASSGWGKRGCGKGNAQGSNSCCEARNSDSGERYNWGDVSSYEDSSSVGVSGHGAGQSGLGATGIDSASLSSNGDSGGIGNKVERGGIADCKGQGCSCSAKGGNFGKGFEGVVAGAGADGGYSVGGNLNVDGAVGSVEEAVVDGVIDEVGRESSSFADLDGWGG